MACGAKGTCKYAARKPGADGVRCSVQQQRGWKWDFCSHQYYCGREKRYVLDRGAGGCALAADAAAEERRALEQAEKKAKRRGRKREA